MIGADRRPKGSTLSANALTCHFIPSRVRSSEYFYKLVWCPSWPALLLYLFCRIHSTTSSNDTYERLHHSLLIASLTLEPSGTDRSTMSLHFPGLFFFGMTPNGLKWIFFTSSENSTILPWASFADRYSSTTLGYCSAESNYDLVISEVWYHSCTQFEILLKFPLECNSRRQDLGIQQAFPSTPLVPRVCRL